MSAGADRATATPVTRAARAALASPRHRGMPKGIWGMALFVCAEVTLFGTLISAYFYLEIGARRWPPPGISPPEALWPALATALLLLSAIPVWFAARSARAARGEAALAALVLAALIQAGYLACQILLFRHDLRQFSPRGSAYGSIYFTLLTAHHAHVALGLAIDLAVIWQLARSGLRRYWVIGVGALALYWYVVLALAVAVLLTQLSPSL